MLEKNPDKIYWINLSLNPNAIHILEQNQDKIYWEYLSINPNAIRLLAKLDYEKMKDSMSSFNCELCAYICHYDRVKRFAEKYNMGFPDLLIIYQ